jgi:hypothetical protein
VVSKPDSPDILGVIGRNQCYGQGEVPDGR